MTTFNELIIDGVRTSSFPFEVVVKESPTVEISESKSRLWEHNGISGAVYQTNKHRSMITKSYTFQLIDPTETQLNEFMGLLTREQFWLESAMVKTTKLWCYKIESTQAIRTAPKLFVCQANFICHPTKYFKEVDIQTISAGEAVLNEHTVWFDVSQKTAGNQNVFVKYSRFADGREFGDTPSNFVGVAKTPNATAPTNPSAYTWQRLSGRDVSLKWANSRDGRLDLTAVTTSPTASIVLKNRPRYEAQDNTNGSVMDIWQTRQMVRLKPNTTYTLTARACSKYYVGETANNAYMRVDFGSNSPIKQYLDFKNNQMEIKKVTFTTPNNLPADGVMVRGQAVTEDEDWTGLSLDWYVLTEGNKTYSDYPKDEPAQTMKYRYFGVTSSGYKSPGGGGVFKTNGSALAHPKITVTGESSTETRFTIGNQVIKLSDISGTVIMTNDPNNPSFLTKAGEPIKWSGDFITVDPMDKETIGVVLGEGITSLEFETIWGWA